MTLPVHRLMVSTPSRGHIPTRVFDNHKGFHSHLGVLTEQSRLLQQVLAGRLTMPEEPLAELKAAVPEWLHGIRLEHDCFFTTSLLVPYARERIAESAVEMGFDEILWLDDDMLFDHSTLYECMSVAKREHEVDILAARCHQRQYPYAPVLYNDVGSRSRIQKGDVQHLIQTQEDFDYPPDQVVEYDMVGFGCVLMDLKILTDLPKPWFMSTTACGEDIYFCWRARAIVGAKIAAHTGIEVGHLGEAPVIGEEYWLKYGKEGAVKQRAINDAKKAKELAEAAEATA